MTTFSDLGEQSTLSQGFVFSLFTRDYSLVYLPLISLNLL